MQVWPYLPTSSVKMRTASRAVLARSSTSRPRSVNSVCGFAPWSEGRPCEGKASLPIPTPNSLMPSEYPPYGCAQIGRLPACAYVTGTCGIVRPVSSVIVSPAAWCNTYVSKATS